jgi:hypothetical protein
VIVYSIGLIASTTFVETRRMAEASYGAILNSIHMVVHPFEKKFFEELIYARRGDAGFARRVSPPS